MNGPLGGAAANGAPNFATDIRREFIGGVRVKQANGVQSSTPGSLRGAAVKSAPGFETEMKMELGGVQITEGPPSGMEGEQT